MVYKNTHATWVGDDRLFSCTTDKVLLFFRFVKIIILIPRSWGRGLWEEGGLFRGELGGGGWQLTDYFIVLMLERTRD